ncbi:phospholipase D-like domain-containing protein [Fodinicurvata halophila]|uniref:Phospholipase D n=1 Tax=Fodinicurvata halophila TaxID=1419723 RepID=A0ABV8URC9_9PROT
MKIREACWKTAEAERIGVIVDGARYFAVLREAMLKAESHILFIGWDFERKATLLYPEEHADSDPQAPAQLGRFLRHIVRRKPELTIRILRWSSSVLLNFGRELQTLIRLGWGGSPQIIYRLDNHHPTIACHHQKLIIIDDRIAFCGSIDLVGNRWDTPEHLANDPRRKRRGKAFGPRHEVAMVVDGAAAQALGELARHRWYEALGETLSVTDTANDPWPTFLEPDFRHTQIGIARTQPAYNEQPEVREIEAINLEAIRHARSFIYIENQYFASRRVTEALAERLQAPDGPDVVVINPEKGEDILEEAAMDSARRFAVHYLKQHDLHGRFAIYTPYNAADEPIYVHSKVLIADDRLLRIGSSNLNNRSMGFDTECDVVIDRDLNAEAGTDTERISAKISDLRNRLLAEHLGLDQTSFSQAFNEQGSLLKTIETLRAEQGRRLVHLDLPKPEENNLVVELQLGDPETPVKPKRLARCHLLRQLGFD